MKELQGIKLVAYTDEPQTLNQIQFKNMLRASLLSYFVEIRDVAAIKLLLKESKSNYNNSNLSLWHVFAKQKSTNMEIGFLLQ
jgi:hypothetical protein